MDKGLIQSAQPASVPETLYAMLESQVISYHKHKRMGSSTSVSQELAKELLESLIYTWNVSGGCKAGETVEQAVTRGRLLLETVREEADRLLTLVENTRPDWQSEMRWDTLSSLRVFVEQYDAAHLAHREPEILFYPLPMELPESIQGIDKAVLYLQILWTENCILQYFPEAALEDLWIRFCQLGWEESVNPCVQAVCQALGKQLLDRKFDSLCLDASEICQLHEQINRGRILAAVKALAERFSRIEGSYIEAVGYQLISRLEIAAEKGFLRNIFL